MLSIEQKSRIIEVISEKLDTKECFTAYDITKVLRHEGQYVYHTEVKGFVHEFMEDKIQSGCEYSRDLEDMPNGKQAFMYRPCDMDDCCDNDDDEEDDVDNEEDGDNEDEPKMTEISLSPDLRGRICLTAPMVRSIGRYPGDMVYCCSAEDSLQVSNSLSDITKHDNFITSYIVDKDNNVRISSRVLRKVFGCNYAYTNTIGYIYNCSLEGNDKIIIK